MPTLHKTTKRPPWTGEKVAFAKDEWRTALYNSTRWRKLSKAEILSEPMCAECLLNGIVNSEQLQRDHVNGFANEQEFWEGKRQTLCKRHNMVKAGKWGRKKQIEGGGQLP